MRSEPAKSEYELPKTPDEDEEYGLSLEVLKEFVRAATLNYKNVTIILC